MPRRMRARRAQRAAGIPVPAGSAGSGMALLHGRTIYIG
jgi:hypothetical protein